MSAAVGIKRYGLDELQELMAKWGEPRFRAKQLAEWLYKRGAASYQEMSNLPVGLRARLSAEEPAAMPEMLRRSVSADGARKYLIRLADGCVVESVGIPSGAKTAFRVASEDAAGASAVAVGDASMGDEAAGDGSADGGAAGDGSASNEADVDGDETTSSARLTVCFSTQVGCALDCKFCATGRLGLTRSLYPGEIADQLLVVARDFGRRPTNAVAMGEGEPFANYDNTLAGLRILNSPTGLGIGARHITVSTCGFTDQIIRFAGEKEQFTLAVSLHSAIQSTRDAIMPRLANQSLQKLRAALVEYSALSGRRPSFEVSLMSGINDSDAEVAALIEYCRGLLCHVNLIVYNPPNVREAGLEFTPSSKNRCYQVADLLTKAGIECSVRRSRGADIDAACGQLKASLA